MKDRLLRLLNDLNYSATRFADEISVQRSGISHILSGRNQPSLDFLIKVLTRFPEIDPEWLILGKGNMYKRQISEIEQPVTPPGETIPIKDDPDKGNSNIDNISRKVTNVTDVQKVILLHDDGTFEVYNQGLL